ncbi:transcriptional activator protein acu-15 [Podospora conica]|nr:transcriptional activator protein acu-15 [Schizothecium conicum]
MSPPNPVSAKPAVPDLRPPGDRLKPACSRCSRINSECVYPEARRKPAFKRRNVKELEERLAQVEGFLKHATESASRKSSDAAADNNSPSEPGSPSVSPVFGGGSPKRPLPRFFLNPGRQQQPLFAPEVELPGNALFGLGRFESLPPFEMIEELHQTFFNNQQHFIPIVHKHSYLSAFYSPAHMRPPMSLQYALWALAAFQHEKYGIYHDAFYRRARQYLEADELKGQGEHFLTLYHAQAWALVATSEACCANFTRAAMSSARTVKLVTIMGLHLLDNPNEEESPIAPTLSPPKNWAELEQRRRVFWAAYCMDSHGSISTGWPALIDTTQASNITTHLPASEEAFTSGEKEETTTLQDAFKFTQYSTFSGAIITCYIFGKLLKHVYRPRPDDRPDDPENGPFWKRHRELDTILSNAFMFLPERFRLPKYLREVNAVHQNLNLHSAVISLHSAACDKIDKHHLPAHSKAFSRARCATAAREIISILRASDRPRVPWKLKGPIIVLSIYCAAAVLMSQAREEPSPLPPAAVADLEFLVGYMDTIGRDHATTRAYFNHLVLDLEHNGIGWYINLPPPKTPETCGYNIPLLARTSVSVRSKPLPPLPGRLPLDKPAGDILPWAGGPPGTSVCGRIISTDDHPDTGTGGGAAAGAKRRRTDPDPRPSRPPSNIWPTIPCPTTTTNLPHRASTPSLSTPSPLTNTTGTGTGAGTTSSTTPAVHVHHDFAGTTTGTIANDDFLFGESSLGGTGAGMLDIGLFQAGMGMAGGWDGADGGDVGDVMDPAIFGGMMSGEGGFDDDDGEGVDGRWFGMMGGGGGGGRA